MSALFQVFERYRTVIDVISTSEVSVALTLDNTDSLEQVVRELKRLGDVEVEHDNAVVCVVGEGLARFVRLGFKNIFNHRRRSDFPDLTRRVER